jgi:acetolactate synthase regulatory subunit
MKKLSPTQLSASTCPARRRLLVVESGACAFSREGGAQFDETVAIAQLRDEPPAKLAQRVLGRVASVERSRFGFDAATLFIGAAIDREAAAARRLIALAVAAHAANNARLSEMVLVVASPRVTDELRAQLLELVDELMLNTDQPLSVRVCFAETPTSVEPDSGVFWTLNNAG